MLKHCPHSRVTGKPGMPEQPGSAETALFLRIASRALLSTHYETIYAYQLHFWIAVTCIE